MTCVTTPLSVQKLLHATLPVSQASIISSCPPLQVRRPTQRCGSAVIYTGRTTHIDKGPRPQHSDTTVRAANCEYYHSPPHALLSVLSFGPSSFAISLVSSQLVESSITAKQKLHLSAPTTSIISLRPVRAMCKARFTPLP